MQIRYLDRIGRLGVLLGSALLALPAAGQEPGNGPRDQYGAALSQARTAANREQIDAAVSRLAALLPHYLQDVDLPLALGGLLLRNGRNLDALYSYQLALANSAPGGEAELGIGLTLLKMGRCLEASVHFHAVLAGAGPHSAAADGLRRCALVPPGTEAKPGPGAAHETPAPATAAPAAAKSESAPRLWLQPLVAQSLYIYQSHPTISYALAPTVRLELLGRGHYYAAVTYRYTYFATRDQLTPPFSQNDLYLDAGWSAKAGGVTLRYAYISDGSSSSGSSTSGSSLSGTSHHVGLAARYSRTVDTLLNLSASIYQDAPVLRGELAWLIPIFGSFSARPAGALQWSPTESYKTLALTLFYHHRVFSLWLGGKIGDERRAAYLNVAYVYNSPARIPYGAWAGAAIRPGAGFTLSLNYSYDRLLRTDTSLPPDSAVHSLTLGLAREF